MEEQRLSRKAISQYGVAGYAISTFTTITVYGLYYFTDVVGFVPAWASMILMIGGLWSAVLSPVVGNWSDHRSGKEGKRRPVLLKLAVPFGIVSWLLFSDFNLGGRLTNIYFIVVLLAFYVAYSLFDVSYTALGTEMSKDYDIRTRLSNSRGAWGCAAGVAVSFSLIIVDVLNRYTGSEKVSWSVMMAAFSLLCTLSILYTWKKTEGLEAIEKESADIQEEKIKFRDFINGPLKNKSFLSVMGMFAFAISAETMICSCIVYFELYNLQMTDLEISIGQVLVYLAGLLSLPLIERVSVRYGKKTCWNLFVGIMIISIMVFIFWLLKPGMLWGVYLNKVLMSAAFQSFYIVIWSMIPDAVDVDEYTTGQRRAGLYYGIISCVQKVGAALVLGASGVYLSWIGYHADSAVQSERALDGIRYMCSIGTAVILIFSLICSVLNPMTKEVHEKLQKEIEKKKKQGNQYKEDEKLLKKIQF